MPIDFDAAAVRLEPVSVIAGAVLALLLWLAGFFTAAFVQRLPRLSRSVAGQRVEDGKADGQQLDSEATRASALAPAASSESDKADDADLSFFKDTAEGVYSDILSSNSAPGGWTLTTDKKVDGLCIYRAFSRPLPNGTTEYLSVTITAGATAHEFAEFCLDDTARLKWDFMLKGAKLISRGDPKKKEQVVTWLRSFPFGFLSDRLYKISRRVLVRGGDVYTLTKHSSHPGAEAYARAEYPEVTQIDKYYSHTRMRTVASPWRSSSGDEQAIAVETLLLHHDELKVPENLARTAIRFGQFSYVRSMGKAAQAWVRQRRARGLDTDAEDPEAFCCRAPTRSASSGGLHTVPSAPALLNSLDADFEAATDAATGTKRAGDQSHKQQQQQHEEAAERARRAGWARAAAWKSSNALVQWWTRGGGAGDGASSVAGSSVAASEASSLAGTPRGRVTATPFSTAAAGAPAVGVASSGKGAQGAADASKVLSDPAMLMGKMGAGAGSKGGRLPLQRLLVRVAVMAAGAGIAALLVAGGDGSKAPGRGGRWRGGRRGRAAAAVRSHDIGSFSDSDEE